MASNQVWLPCNFLVIMGVSISTRWKPTNTMPTCGTRTAHTCKFKTKEQYFSLYPLSSVTRHIRVLVFTLMSIRHVAAWLPSLKASVALQWWSFLQFIQAQMPRQVSRLVTVCSEWLGLRKSAALMNFNLSERTMLSIVCQSLFP